MTILASNLNITNMRNQTKFFLTLFLLFFSVGVFSQSLVLSAGGNYATGVFKFGQNSEGIDANFKGPGFQGGVSFEGVITGSRKEEVGYSLGLFGDYKMTTQDLTNESENKANLLYVNVPAYLFYRYKLRSKNKIYVGIGPYLGIGMAGKIMNDKVQWGNEEGVDHLKRFDYGLSGKIGYRGFYGLDIAASYDYGIPNVFSIYPSGSLKHRAIRLSIGYTLDLAD